MLADPPPPNDMSLPTCWHFRKILRMSAQHVIKFCQLDHARQHGMSWWADVSAISFGHEGKIAKSHRKSHCIGILWCVQVTKTVKDVIIYGKVPVWTKKWPLNSNRVMSLAVMDLDRRSCYDTSANTWPTHESSHDFSNMVTLAQFKVNIVGIVMPCEDILPKFSTKV